MTLPKEPITTPTILAEASSKEGTLPGTNPCMYSSDKP